jgi:hypothetical protein
MGVYNHGQGVVELPFLDFAPDLAYDTSNLQNAIALVDMNNAMPTVKGYQCLNSPAPIAIACPGAVLGSTLGFFSNGAVINFAGTSASLYRLDTYNTWTNVGNVPANGRWRFAQFGDDIIAVNGGSPLGYPTVTTPAQVSSWAAPFTPLGGSPPNNANCLCSVNGQVLMFGPTDGWACSALGTDNNWTPNIQTQAGSGILYDYPGNIVACAPIFRNVVAFKQSATWLGSYAGGYAVWSWQLISDLTGTWCQESVVIMPDSVAFLGNDDFYVCSGYTPQRIPNSIKEWFFDVADPTQFTNMLSRYDATHGICYWYWVSKTPPHPGVPDRWVAWNPRTGRWGTGYLSQGAFSVPYPNQQPGWLGGIFYDANYIPNTWTGTPGTMYLTTGYFGNPNNYSQCMRVKPIYYVEPASATVQPYHVVNLGDPDITGPTTFLNPTDGWFYFRQTDRWHKFTVTTTGPNIPPTTVSQTGCEISAIALEMRQSGWR